MKSPMKTPSDSAVLLLFDVRLLPTSPEETARLATRLTHERRKKYERYRFESDKRRALVAGLALECAFGASAREIRVDEFGKPYLPGGAFFNLSHSGDWVALAVDSRGAVGCDVQIRQETLKPEIIAKRFFHSTEYEAFLSSAPEERERVFYRTWALKESCLKALGRGFRIAPTSFAVDAGAAPRLVERAPEDDAQDWNLRVWDFEGGALALCALGDVASVEPERVDYL